MRKGEKEGGRERKGKKKEGKEKEGEEKGRGRRRGKSYNEPFDDNSGNVNMI